MKISILTPTYNRGNLLKNLYESLIENSKYEIEIEWLIMDDGSADDTENKVKEFIQENKLSIKYYKQTNQGKMNAINNLIPNVTGEYIIECDSDDYFTNDAFKIIKEEIEKNKNEEDIYALCFLKHNQNGKNIGKEFKNRKTTMFDLYFKEGEDGEKAIVFKTDIRKKYKYELEKNEKFITEARMYHKMDLKYKMLCINKPIMVCEYKEDGYTKNIIEQFKKYPYGYYEYFKEIFEHDMKGVLWNKRLYVIKHYILFATLTKNRRLLKNVKGIENKLLVILLLFPGMLKTKIKFKNRG